jgi:diguanylate cyclase (GGDEF)-like protein
MDDRELSRRVAGRLAGVLFVGCAVLTAAALPLPQADGNHRGLVLVLALAALAVGAAATVIPWHRWDRRASLALPPIAFALISAGNYFANAQPYTYSVFFIVAFVWVGLTHKRWTSIPLLPAAAVAYLVPFALRHRLAGPGGASVVPVVAVCVFVAEAIAWISARNRHSYDQSAALARVALSLGPHLNVDGLGETLAAEMRVVLRAERAVFFLVGDRTITRVFSAGYSTDERERLAALVGLPLGDTPGLAELGAGRPVVVEDVRDGSPLIDEPLRYGVRSYAAVPVLVEETLTGVLACIERAHPRRYRADDLRTAQALAAQAGAALRNALLYERTLEAAQRDHLTGLGNRRAFHERLDTEIERARRHSRRLSVVVLDLDQLKAVNDAGGHVAGDDLLGRVGRLLEDGSRREDGVYRLGGDEFALVLPETDADRASSVAERIRVTVERAHVGVDEGRELTVSVGVSAFPDHGINADELYERADSAMYEAKRAGRNAVCVATSAEPAGPGVRFGIDIGAVLSRDLLAPVYQRIFALPSMEVIGREAYCRLDPSYAVAPTSTLFRAAAGLGLVDVLDRRCRAIALDGARGLPQNELLFVNVSAAALASGKFELDELLQMVATVGLRPDRVVLEVTQHERKPAPAFVTRLAACHSAGLKLSLDDFGDTASDLDVVSSLPFDFVKIDARILRGDEDVRRRLVTGLLVVAREVGARIFAEGVETDDELVLVADLGFEAAQGYHLHAPAPRLQGGSAPSFASARPQ